MSLEVEFGDMSRTGGTFATLARRSGFSEAECALAAEHDLLAGIVRVAELRGRRTRAESPTYRGRTLSGAQALSRLQLLWASWD
jgi:hypothetical protein